MGDVYLSTASAIWKSYTTHWVGSPYELIVEARSIIVLGKDLSILRNAFISIATTDIAISGKIVSLLLGRILTIDSRNIIVLGKSIDLLKNSVVTVGSDSLTIAGTAVSLFRNYVLIMGDGSIIVLGSDVGLIAPLNLRALLISIPDWEVHKTVENTFTIHQKIIDLKVSFADIRKVIPIIIRSSDSLTKVIH